MTDVFPVEEQAPVAQSPLRALRDRWPVWTNPTQREVDRVLEALRAQRRPGRHRK